jgi:hypothetical protein
MKKTLPLFLLSLLAVTSNAADSIPAKLAWTANPAAENVTSYEVAELDILSPFTPHVIGTVLSTAPALEFALVLDGLPHTYTVCARNAFYTSLPATVSAPTKPSVPTGFGILRAQ